MSNPTARDQPLPIRLILNIFICIVFFSGLILLILWLSLRPHRPVFHVHDFSVLGLDQPNGLENARILFNVTVRNGNLRVGIAHQSLYGLVYYKNEEIASTLPLHSFYQGPKNTTIVHRALYGTTLGVHSQHWMEFMNDRSQGIVDFRLELVSRIKYKSAIFDNGRRELHTKCDIAVGSNGILLPSYENQRCSK